MMHSDINSKIFPFCFLVATDLDFNSTAEISEEEQIRLLNEYQKEMEAEKQQQEQELTTKDNHYAENSVNPTTNEKGMNINHL